MKTVIEMAIEAGLIDFRDPFSAEYTKAVVEDLTAFAELVRADERKACAKFFDDNDTNMFWGSQAAQHIRARSNL